VCLRYDKNRIRIVLRIARLENQKQFVAENTKTIIFSKFDTVTIKDDHAKRRPKCHRAIP